MLICETERLRISKLRVSDAAFILELVNEPGFKDGIEDKKIRNLSDARVYLLEGPITSYGVFGYGPLQGEPEGFGGSRRNLRHFATDGPRGSGSRIRPFSRGIRSRGMQRKRRGACFAMRQGSWMSPMWWPW